MMVFVKPDGFPQALLVALAHPSDLLMANRSQYFDRWPKTARHVMVLCNWDSIHPSLFHSSLFLAKAATIERKLHVTRNCSLTKWFMGVLFLLLRQQQSTAVPLLRSSGGLIGVSSMILPSRWLVTRVVAHGV